MRPDDRAVDVVDLPIDLAVGVSAHLQALEDALPETRVAPPVEAAVDGLPGAVALGQVAPWAPVRSTQRMPFTIVRSSWRGRPAFPRWSGRNRRMRSNSASVRSKRPIQEL